MRDTRRSVAIETPLEIPAALKMMRTVELFAGIGGFRIAADARGLCTIWANDIDPKACAVYRSKFGNRELREGDIRDLLADVPGHDLLTAGFPCQPFSSAGKKNGVRDPRGTLFQNIVDVLDRHRPERFILENVKRLLTMEEGYHFATILASLSDMDYTVEWRLINAMDVGLPQNRQRVFLLGVKEADFRSPPGKSNPVISTRLATKTDLSELCVRQREDLADWECWTRIEEHDARFPAWGLARSGRFYGASLTRFSTAMETVPLRAVLQDDVQREFDFTEATLKWLEDNTPVNRFVQGVEILSNQAGGARMGYTIFGISGVAPTLTSTASRHYERYKVGNRYRRLTNVEYARIQGFPDDHCVVASVYDQYALFGSAVPPAMAGWVMDRMSVQVAQGTEPRSKRQLGLFKYADQRRA